MRFEDMVEQRCGLQSLHGHIRREQEAQRRFAEEMLTLEKMNRVGTWRASQNGMQNQPVLGRSEALCAFAALAADS